MPQAAGLEKAIRGVIQENAFSDLRVGSTIVSVREDNGFVYVEYTSADGILRKMRSRFTVGADGKTGYTQKRYLVPKGIIMEQCSQSVDPPQTLTSPGDLLIFIGHRMKQHGLH